MDIEPTEKTVTVTGIEVNRFADGKLVESWTQPDTLGLLHQFNGSPKQPVD